METLNEQNKELQESASSEEELKKDEVSEKDLSLPEEKKPKQFLKNFAIFLSIIVLFGLSFRFQAVMGELGPVGDIENNEIKSIYEKYYLFSGLVFGFLSGILFLVLNIFSRFTKGFSFYFKFIIVFLSLLPWYLFARQLVFHENRIVDFAKATISYIGYPLLATTKFLFLLLFIIFVIMFLWRLRKKITAKSTVKIFALLIMPMSLSGCLGGMAGITCYLLPESDHCFQAAAMQENDPAGCEKIKGEGFQGSNPPKDKCYLKIAMNTGELSICDSIEGGMYSYTKEECYKDTSIKHENPSGCKLLNGADKESCRSALADVIKPASVLAIDDQIKVLEEELKNEADAGLQKQLDELRQKRADHLDVMNEENKKEYEETSDPLNIEANLDFYAGKIDEKTKDSLIALNNRLREQGNSMNEKEYKAMRDVLAYKNDPKNDIENMDDNEIVKLRWNEKMANAKEFFKFWKANKTSTEEKYDEQLLFYQRMMERQEAIDKGLSQKQQDQERELNRITGYIKDELTNAVIDEAKKQAFGELLDLVDSSASAPTVAILGEAIDVVKSEAQAKEFRGLVRAYNLGMEEELAKRGGNIEKAHAAVVAEMQKNAYAYEDQNTFAKYGNLLENKECDGKNPLCLKKDIFWKSMKKSYKYQQGKK